METPTTPAPENSPASSNAETGAAGSPQPAAVQAEIPGMAELKKALAETTTEAGADEPTPGKVRNDEFTMAAAGTVSALTTVAILGMGAHVKPDEQQVVAMVEAYAAAYRHYGYKPAPPPWLGPVIATAMWIGPHFADERSQTNLQKWKTKAVNAWLWIRAKIDGRAAAAAAQNTAQ